MINEKFSNEFSTFNNSIPITFLYSLRNKFNSEVSYKSDCRTFYDKLLEVSKSKGLGDNITIQTVYEGNIPERIFTIILGDICQKKIGMFYWKKLQII